MYGRDPYKAKYQSLINKTESTGLKHFNDPQAFIEYQCKIFTRYWRIQHRKNRKILIVFDDMIVDMSNNKKLNSIVTELFIRGRTLHISLAFITKSYFKFPKEVKSKFYPIFCYENSK